MRRKTITVRRARPEDLAEILEIQHEAFGRVARELRIEPAHLPPLCESHADLCELHETGTAFFVACAGDSPVGSVRGHESDSVVEFGRLVVSARYLRRGVATELMRVAEDAFPDADRFELFTGADAHGALALYTALGYRVFRTETVGGVPLVWLEKMRTDR